MALCLILDVIECKHRISSNLPRNEKSSFRDSVVLRKSISRKKQRYPFTVDAVCVYWAVLSKTIPPLTGVLAEHMPFTNKSSDDFMIS